MEQKRKRGRPRKTQLPEEIQKIVDDVKEKEQSEVQEIIQEAKQNLNKERTWDIKAEDEIKYFDANLSYELTGYRPINKTQGLDFDPSWFTEVRETFKRTGHYCEYRSNTKAYADFWNEQYRRCRNGMTVNDYTITGDHYFFLNYYQLMDLSTSKAGEGRIYDFPTFFVAQYEFFHYIELCKRLRKNAVLMKARGVGYSEIDASIAANTYNCRRNSVTVLAAQQDNYVSKTLDKVWKALSFLNDYTDGGFFKLRQVSDTQYLKKASYYKIVNGQKVESGWMSQIQGIVADKPNKIRGDRTDLLLYEEGGSWPNSTKAFIQGDALVGIQGKKFGIKVIGGTGGDSGGALEGLRSMYENPEEYDVLPYKHNFTATGEVAYTGYFIPAFTVVNTPECMDSRGFTDPDKGKAYYNKQREKLAHNPKSLVIYAAEYCYTAEEGFSQEGDNKFNKVNITEQITQVNILKKGPKIETGNLDYIFKNNQHTPENVTGLQWKPSKDGKIKIIEHPLWTLDTLTDPETGEVVRQKVSEMRGLYVIGIDGIDIGASQTSEYTKDPSDFCLVVKKRVYGLQNPQYVALYKDRPNDIRDAYKIAIKLAQYYNAIINIEATRMSLVNWARDHKYLQYFMKRPRATLSDVARGKSNQYGTPATNAIIAHQTDLIADFVNDYCHTIWFSEMLDELHRYNDENKRKFDIVAAMAMAELADEELSGVVPKQIENYQEQWSDIGYYIDEYGYKRKGIIPKNRLSINVSNNFDIQNDYSKYGTSDPRSRSGYLSEEIYRSY